MTFRRDQEVIIRFRVSEGSKIGKVWGTRQPRRDFQHRLDAARQDGRSDGNATQRSSRQTGFTKKYGIPGGAYRRQERPQEYVIELGKGLNLPGSR